MDFLTNEEEIEIFNNVLQNTIGRLKIHDTLSDAINNLPNLEQFSNYKFFLEKWNKIELSELYQDYINDFYTDLMDLMDKNLKVTPFPQELLEQYKEYLLLFDPIISKIQLFSLNNERKSELDNIDPKYLYLIFLGFNIINDQIKLLYHEESKSIYIYNHKDDLKHCLADIMKDYIIEEEFFNFNLNGLKIIKVPFKLSS